jgi:hypothetical protein
MKRVNTKIGCLKALLKKRFFNLKKTDLNHDCKKAFAFELNTGDFNSSNDEAEEYLINYTSTTRWQTV